MVSWNVQDSATFLEFGGEDLDDSPIALHCLLVYSNVDHCARHIMNRRLVAADKDKVEVIGLPLAHLFKVFPVIVNVRAQQYLERRHHCCCLITCKHLLIKWKRLKD